MFNAHGNSGCGAWAKDLKDLKDQELRGQLEAIFKSKLGDVDVERQSPSECTLKSFLDVTGRVYVKFNEM